MKITRRDLDVDVLNKLDCLDKVKDTFDENNPDGFISYNPKSGFYFKKTNDTFLKKVFVEDEIVALEKALTSKDRNIRSTMYEDLRLDNKLNSATQSFLIANSLTHLQCSADLISLLGTKWSGTRAILSLWKTPSTFIFSIS